MSERLYNLLPAIHRVRDAEQGYRLRALLAVIEHEHDLLEEDIARLYDNWFVETCDEWVVPYIGDLVGVKGLAPVESGAFSQRALVANTLAYRRAKGTAAVLEQLARDVTGWPARAVEFFELLAATQYLNHVRPGKGGTVDLRDTDKLELIGGPFQTAAATAEVRHIDNGRGRFNIPNVGLFLWRLQSYSVSRGTARPVADPPDGRLTFNPLGLDAPLFNRPRTETELAQVASEENVPGRFRRRPLHDELEARRQALVKGKDPRQACFDDEPVFEVFVQAQQDDQFRKLRPEEILICHLGDWRRPDTDTYQCPDGSSFTTQVGVDPVLGRLSFPAGVVPHQVEVSYRYGFSGDLGGGPYDRRLSLAGAVQRATWQRGVTRDAPPGDAQLVPTLEQAIQEWNAQPAGVVGVIALMDSRTYKEDLTGEKAVKVPAGSVLVIAAGDWPVTEAGQPRLPGRLAPSGRRPHLAGNLSVEGTASPEALNPGELVIDGLLIEGALTVLPGNLKALDVLHSTLVPGKGGLLVAGSPQSELRNPRLAISVERSVIGAIEATDHIASLAIKDSIVTGANGPALQGPATRVDTSTILGEAGVRSLEAGNSVFTGKVSAVRRQVGCVRFCCLPLGSTAPRRYRCQPADAATAARLVPQFTSVTYGDPGFIQLAPACPAAISSGAEDEGEMGAFHFLEQVHRIKNLRAGLNEYLRFGLEAGIFFVT